MLTLQNGLIASAFSIVSQLFRNLVSIVSLIILARILTPEDYGLVAIALLFLNFSDVVTQFGGRNYLMSQKELRVEDVMTNWTLEFTVKAVMASFIACASPFIAGYYDDQRLLPILLVICLQIIIATSASPGLVYKLKNQQLGQITKWQMITRFCSTCIAIGIAVVYETYWALVIGQFLAQLSSTYTSYIIAPCRPKFTLKNIGNQWQFSKWIVPQSSLNYFKNQMDAIYVSTIFAKSTMGAYNAMRYYASIPATVFVQPIMRTTLTQFSQFKDVPNYFSKQLQVIVFGLGCIVAPASFLMMSLDYQLVKLILGDKWVNYASLLGIFSLFIFVNTLTGITSQVVMLRDTTKLLFYFTVTSALSNLVLFTTIDFDSVFKLALYKVVVDITICGLFFVLVIIRTLSFESLLRIITPIPFIAFAIFAGSVAFETIPQHQILIFDIVIKSGVFGLTYGAALIICLFVLRKHVACFEYTLSKFNSVAQKVTGKKRGFS